MNMNMENTSGAPSEYSQAPQSEPAQNLVPHNADEAATLATHPALEAHEAAAHILEESPSSQSEATQVSQPATLQTAESPEPVDVRVAAEQSQQTQAQQAEQTQNAQHEPELALPEAPPREPPRPLVAGAFLGGEYEIKQLLSRGFTNLYLAYAGDYSAPEPKLIAERDEPQNVFVEEDVSTHNAPEIAEAVDEAAQSGAFVEDVDALPDEDNSSSLQPPASSLLPPFQFFTQDEREYLVFDYFASRALQDFRAPTNDEQLLQMLSTLADGLAQLDAQNLSAELTTDTLRVDENGHLRYVGFASPKSQSSPDALQSLRDVTRFLLKRVFAESSTMRLDDEFGALMLAEETKTLARQIDENEFETVAQAADAIRALLPSTHIAVQSAILSDVGQEREINEDSGMILKIQRHAVLDRRDLELYVVADGMGGHEGGEVASDLTMRALETHLNAKSAIDWNDNVAVKNALLEVIDLVNADVVALTETPRYKGTRAKPGSTLVFALRLGARVFVGNVGDSRAYKYSNGVLERISKDHSYVQTLIDRGEITEEEAFDHPEGSVITAHIGFPKLKTRDVFLRLFKAGDKLLLVSDGVTDMLRDREYLPHLNDNPEAVCRNLVDASNAAGGFDNITVVCLEFS
jgi:PPM family protein phosphatase